MSMIRQQSLRLLMSQVKPIFPQEVFENIIDCCAQLRDYLGDRLPVLHTCALICRAWLPRSRYHLFYKVYIHARSTLDRLLSTIGKTPALSEYIQYIQVLSDDVTRPDAAHTTMMLLARKLQSLQRVDFIDLILITPPSFLMLIPHLKAVTTIHITASIHGTLLDLIKFLASLPVLTHLEFNLWKGPQNSKFSVQSPLRIAPRYRLRPSLSSLTVIFPQTWYPAFIDWLITTPSTGTLNRLSLTWNDTSKDLLDASGRLLRECGPSITDVALSCSNALSQWRANPDEIPVITLAQNLNLCSLRFGLVSDLLLISQLILSLPTGVKEVVILQQQAGDGPIGEFKDDFCQQWTSIDQHLSHTKFEHLRKVVVNVTGLSSAAKLFRVEQLLPKLLARGTLDTKQRRFGDWS